MENLVSAHRRKAQAWIGRLNRMYTDQWEDRQHLIKHAVLAFEFYRAQDNLARLEEVEDRGPNAVLALFRDLDSLEQTLYGQIVQKCLSVIRILEKMVEDNACERELQKYIFDHLWMLEPAGKS